MTKGASLAPLRRVLSIVKRPIPGTQSCKRVLLLECGHTARIPQDHMGERYPARRRCQQCAAALSATEESA